MGTKLARTGNGIGCAAVVAAALMLAGPTSAESGKILVDQDVGGDCPPPPRQEGGCLIYTADFTTSPSAKELSIAVTSPGTYRCVHALVEIQRDGQIMGQRRVGPGWEEGPLVIPLGTGGDIEPGSHDVSTQFKNPSDCKVGEPRGFRGHLQVLEIVEAAPPPPPRVTLPKAAVPLATVNADVDVYNAKNEPDGAGQVVGILRAEPRPQKVELVGSCAPSSWCQVKGANVPGGTGWVWGHLDLP